MPSKIEPRSELSKKREPWRNLKYVTPRHYPRANLPYNDFPPWSDDPPELATREILVLKTYVDLAVATGRRPATEAIVRHTGLPRAKVLRVMVDASLSGAAHLMDSPGSGWPALSVHPKLWAWFGVEKPPAPAPAPAMVSRLQLTAKTILRIALEWYELFAFWPEPRDLSRPLCMSDEGVRHWLLFLRDAELVRYGTRSEPRVVGFKDGRVVTTRDNLRGARKADDTGT